MLIEKAWAKVHGTFARVSGGLSGFACAHLTGVPSEKVMTAKVKDPDHLWKKLRASHKKNFSMMCSSVGKGEKNMGNGIITGHAYTVVDLRKFEHNGKIVRLIRLRNPWGQGEWTGDWGTNSSLWTNALRKQMDEENLEDNGIFYMPFSDFMTHFSSMSICADLNPEKYFINH